LTGKELNVQGKIADQIHMFGIVPEKLKREGSGDVHIKEE